MPAPTEENPMRAAKAKKKELQQQGLAQLQTAAASERAAMGGITRRGEHAEKEIARAGGKAFAGALGRQAGRLGIGSVGGLGTLQQGVTARRTSARGAAAEELVAQRRKAEDAEQEVTKFQIEAEKSPEEIAAENEALDAQVDAIAENNPDWTTLGHNEKGMRNDVEAYIIDNDLTPLQAKRMRERARVRYKVTFPESRRIQPAGTSDVEMKGPKRFGS